MTEDQIERRAEVMADSLDRRFLSGPMTQAAYDAECAMIATWVANQHALNRSGG